MIYIYILVQRVSYIYLNGSRATKGITPIGKKGNYHYVTYFDMLKYDDCQILLIENYPCSSKYEFEARERYHIESNTCINKHIPTRSKREYRLATKYKKREYDIEYREKNKETRN